ncbi:peptidyl-prolyl cis-trans isomerase-like 3 isoform X18 [Rhipicephalus microplus]|uniref:peptidyl-prolyl cis-trans isomerase-like 3 isoform X18 n=1 Tax=Rhipicephalus microplus TaxID=6941 RepID=UPI003F6B20DA
MPPQPLCSKISLSKSVTLHTDLGDIKVELFCEACPKTTETTTMAASSTATSRASWCRQATLQVREKEVRASGVKTSPTKFRMDSRYNPSCAIEGRAEASFNLWCHLAFQRHSVRGVVSMANNGPNTNASQFFITYAKQPHLDQKYTVFGKVIDGLDTLEELEKVPVNPKYRPLRDIKLNSVTIHANPFAE